MQEYTGDTLPDLARLRPVDLTDEPDPSEIEELKRKLLDYCLEVEIVLEIDLVELTVRAGLVRQLRELFSELVSDPLAYTQEKVLFIDYLHIATLLLTKGKEALINKYEVEYQIEWSKLSTEKQAELFPLIIQWYLENWRLKSRSYLETLRGKSGVNVGFELEFEVGNDLYNYVKKSKWLSYPPPKNYNLLLPLSGMIAAFAPVTNTVLTSESTKNTLELITGPSSSHSRVGLLEILKLVEIGRVEMIAHNQHTTISGVKFGPEHPDLIEARVLLEAFPPQFSNQELLLIETSLSNGRNYFEENMEKHRVIAEGVEEFMPYFKRRFPDDNNVVSYRGSAVEVLELRSFDSFSCYENWFSSFCRRTNFLLAMAKGIAANQVQEDERDECENQMANAWTTLLNEWKNLKRLHGLETPPYTDFFIEISQKNLIERLRQMIEDGHGDSLLKILHELIKKNEKLHPHLPQENDEYKALIDHLFNGKELLKKLLSYQITEVLTAIGAKVSPYLYYDTIMYESIVNHEFNAEMRRILREYRKKIREIESKKFERAREEQRQRVQKISESIRAILNGT